MRDLYIALLVGAPAVGVMLGGCPGGATSRCTTTTDCPAGMVCDVARGHCVMPGSVDGPLYAVPDLTPVPESGVCSPGEPLRCGPICVDPQSDPDHCGGCDHSCGANARCMAGDCGCEDGFSDCNSSPADGCECTGACEATSCAAPAQCSPATPDSCGGEGRYCHDGSCADCPDGRQNCNGVDDCECTAGCDGDACASGDPCAGVSCGSNEHCVNGTCQCNAGYERCSGKCVVFGTDANCTGCGDVCGTNASCAGAAAGCECKSGYSDCNGDGGCECNTGSGMDLCCGNLCITVGTDAHCTSCAGCGLNAYCDFPVGCKCKSGYSDCNGDGGCECNTSGAKSCCSGECVNTEDDLDHCGECNHQCTCPAGQCCPVCILGDCGCI